MCARIDVIGVARTFASNYVKANPQATEDQVQNATRNHLLELQARGEKVPAKKLAQVSSTVSGVYAQRNIPVAVQNTQEALAVRQPNPKVETATNKMSAKIATKQYTSADAGKYYYQNSSLSKNARHNLHERTLKDVKSAFGGDEYMEFLRQNHPELIQEEPKPISNKQNKKHANADYQSSKKVKQAKKQAEVRSKEEHAKVRAKNTRPQRNAEYCTKNGIMSTEAGAKANLQRVLTEIADSAKRTIPLADWIAPERHFANINPQDLEVAFGVPIEKENVAKTSTATVSQAETVVDEAKDIVKNTGKKTAEEVANASKKATKSHNKILMAVGGVGLAIATAFGYQKYEKMNAPQNAQPNQPLNAVA